MFKRRTDEEKAARAQRKAEKKAEANQRVTEMREKLRADKERRKADEIDALKALLQDGETLDGMFRANDVLMKKHVLVTSKRLIVGFDAKNAESIFYSHVARGRTSRGSSRSSSARVQVQERAHRRTEADGIATRRR